MIDFLTEYEELAAEIAKEAREDSRALSDRIDAFKALTPFYLQKTKGKKADTEEADGFTFSNFQLDVTENNDGIAGDEPGLRDRRRNGN